MPYTYGTGYGHAGYEGAMEKLRNDWAPTAAQQYDQAYEQSMRDAGSAADAAYGRAMSGDTAAQHMLRQGAAQAQAQTAAQAVGRGANAGVERGAMYAGAGLQSQALGQAATLRAQEIQAAEDRRMASEQWQAEQWRSRSDEDFRRQQEMQRWAMEQQRLADADDSADAANAQAGVGTAATAAMTAASIAAMLSDRRLKQSIDPADPAALDATARGLEGYTYEYREPLAAVAGRGLRPGIMADDLEATPLGKLAVVDSPAGKGVDRDAALGLSLAEIGRLAERVDSLEGKAPAPKMRRMTPTRDVAWKGAGAPSAFDAPMSYDPALTGPPVPALKGPAGPMARGR